MEKMKIPKARLGSIENLLHKIHPKNKLILLDDHGDLDPFFYEVHGHRAIGVVYHPERERGNYVNTKLADRYNAFIFLDETIPLHPLHIEPDGHLIPETYPFTV
jgi:erythromycin esterase